jgi:hypothetical protein
MPRKSRPCAFILLLLAAGCASTDGYPGYSGSGYPGTWPPGYSSVVLAPDKNGRYPCWALPPGSPASVSCQAQQAGSAMPDIPLQPGPGQAPSFSMPSIPGFSGFAGAPSPPGPPASLLPSMSTPGLPATLLPSDVRCHTTSTRTEPGSDSSEIETSSSCHG